MSIHSLRRVPRSLPLGYPFVVIRIGARCLCYPAEPEQPRTVTIREALHVSVKFQCIAWVCWSDSHATLVHPDGRAREVSPTCAGPLDTTPPIVEALSDVIAVEAIVGLTSELHGARMEYGHPNPAPALRRYWDHVLEAERSKRQSFAYRVVSASLCEGLRVSLRHAQPPRRRLEDSTVHWVQQVGKTLLVVNERLGQFTA